MIFSRQELSQIFKKPINYDVDDISVNSRKIKRGDLFIALKGERIDGHFFVKQAIENGANLALVSKLMEINSDRIVYVPDTYDALLQLAKYNLNKARAKYIGVTGSVGKTTTKNLIYHLLAKFLSNEVYVSRKNFNSQIGLPICVAGMPKNTKIGIFEMGMSQKNDLKKLIEIVSPNISVISQICETHLEFFDCVWDIAKAKSEIMETKIPQDAVIIPADSAYTNFLGTKAKNLGIKNIFTFGFSKSDAQIISTNRFENRTEVVANILGEKFSYNINSHNNSLVPNSVSSILAAHVASGISLKNLSNEIQNFSDTENRGKIFEKNDIIIIDDSYNACYTSTRSAIESLSRYSGRKILVLGDMKELGKDSKYFHENLAAAVDKFGVDLVFACGDLMKNLFENLSPNKKGSWFENSQKLSEKITSYIQKSDRILVKGSHSMEMNKVVEAIKNVL